MIQWLTYFFGGFFSDRRSQECQWRSLGNTALGALCAFVLLVCGLTWGYRASFGPLYRSAEDFRSFACEALTEAELTVSGGVISGGEQVKTYEKGGYKLVLDLRDTQHLYDDFTLLCTSDTRAQISYEEYLAQPAYIQQAYTDFTVVYSGSVLPIEELEDTYVSYLRSVTSDESSALYQQDIAEDFAALQQSMPEDYCEQLYLLYVQAYYPELTLREYGAEAPTLHGYYYDRILSDTEGTLLYVFRDTCYVGFVSGSRNLFFVGDYSGFDGPIADAQDTDAFITAVFRSGSRTDGLMYAVNTFGLFFVIIAAWLLLAALVYFTGKKSGAEAIRTFGASAQLVGSYLLFSGLIAALCCFLLSFVLSQTAVYYLSAVLTVLCLGIRSLRFVCTLKPQEE